ncbi:MAG: hypothetical protein FRX49_01389 [Trebouxia sp. A1-2]|nr:MAG: hypothetical protein FRX49_01389 [Trebouxia sp. A1-2]
MKSAGATGHFARAQQRQQQQQQQQRKQQHRKQQRARLAVECGINEHCVIWDVLFFQSQPNLRENGQYFSQAYKKRETSSL